MNSNRRRLNAQPGISAAAFMAGFSSAGRDSRVRLTPEQWRALELIRDGRTLDTFDLSGPLGRCDLDALLHQGHVLAALGLARWSHYHCEANGNLSGVYTITEAGRSALAGRPASVGSLWPDVRVP